MILHLVICSKSTVVVFCLQIRDIGFVVLPLGSGQGVVFHLAGGLTRQHYTVRVEH